MLAAGLAALVAAMVTWIVGGAAGHEWIRSLLTFSLLFALVLLSTAVGAILLLPTAELSTPVRRKQDEPVPTPMILLLAGLAGAAALQLPLIMSWLAEDQRLLVQTIGTGSDPLGLWMIPAAILYSIPSLATAALVTSVLAPLMATIARADLMVQTLMSCAAMQAGLVAGVHLLLWKFRETGSQLLMLFQDAREPSTQLTSWFATHDAVATPAAWRLVWLLGGFLAVIAVSEILAPRRQRRAAAGASARIDVAASDASPEVPLPRPARISSASSAFDYSNYCVKPRRTFLQSLMLRWYPEYDIQTIPPMSRARFSFSWKTGLIRREPAGPDLVVVEPAECRSLLSARSYAVIDSVSAARLATIVPHGPQWDIVDPVGHSIGRVEKDNEAPGFASYVAIVNDEVVCRFTWGMPGYLSHSSELEVEFLRGTNAPFERAVMIALGPILEHKSRMASERAIALQSS
jgi:hypothetical protein